MPEERPHVAMNRTLDTGAHRARAIVASLQVGEPGSAEVFDAFWELDALPVDEVRDALASWIGPLPDPLRLLRLRTLSVERDADVLDLGPVAEEQLRLAGTSWDGADLAPEERLDGELEGSFAGTLERRVLADADAPGETPLFDVLLFDEGSGVVFAAGTTNVVALIAYRKVELRDPRTRTAIEEAIAPPEETVAKKAPEKATAKKTSKKTAAKKAPKKTAAKKTPKKAAAKKATAPGSARKAAVKKRTTAPRRGG